MFDYAEACPISKASSVLCERWTLQIVREMFMGATRFSELQKYLPRLSPALLNSRLRMLEAQGIVVRKRIPERKGFEYRLTPMGMALKPLLTEFGKWGMAWVFRSMDGDELNVAVIVRDFALVLDTAELPAGQCVIQFNVQHGAEASRKFIMVRDGAAQACDENLGTEVDVYISADLKTLYEIWYGDIGINAACQKSLMKVVGAPAYTRHIAKWLRNSQFAQHNRKNAAIPALAQ
jgi:DNA-binding HxlR family transcriptional regulator